MMYEGKKAHQPQAGLQRGHLSQPSPRRHCHLKVISPSCTSSTLEDRCTSPPTTHAHPCDEAKTRWLSTASEGVCSIRWPCNPGLAHSVMYHEWKLLANASLHLNDFDRPPSLFPCRTSGSSGTPSCALSLAYYTTCSALNQLLMCRFNSHGRTP